MAGSFSQTGLIVSAVRPARAQPDLAVGGVRLTLRIEGFAASAATLMVYACSGWSWPAFAALFLAPDLAMLAYLAGPRWGAFGYNLAHTYALALSLALAGFVAGSPFATACGLIWIAHIGADRAVGYGLKYPTAFGDTHLDRVGFARH